MEKVAKEKRKLRRTRTGSTFCFLAFALPPAVCALAPLAPPASDLPPPLVVVAAPDLPLAAAPLAASECAVNVSYTVGTALIFEKSASLYKREKSDKGKGKHTRRQSSHRHHRHRRRRQSPSNAPPWLLFEKPRLGKSDESRTAKPPETDVPLLRIKLGAVVERHRHEPRVRVHGDEGEPVLTLCEGKKRIHG